MGSDDSIKVVATPIVRMVGPPTSGWVEITLGTFQPRGTSRTSRSSQG